jgi:5-methylcytosine-specific restriction protein A
MRDSRPSASQRLYGSRWDKARKTYLEHHPLCVACRNHGRNTKATVVDHIKPHNRNLELFWNQANWTGLCSRCHADKRAFEATGKKQYSGGKIERGCTVDGSPIDPAHPWHRRQ